jgi:hypothetical protein
VTPTAATLRLRAQHAQSVCTRRKPPHLGCNFASLDFVNLDFVNLDETERSFRRHVPELVSNGRVAPALQRSRYPFAFSTV